MAFLAPWLLGGLALLAVPVLVHLTRRERTTPVAFPSLMFLEQAPHELTRRRRIRDWPLFLLRVLAVVLLVVAFARPFATRAAAPIAAPGTRGREVVILLDRSYSMGAGDRWSRAVAAARGTIAGLASGDHATLVLFDQAAQVAQAATDDRARLSLALDSAHVGAGITRYTPALSLAGQILSQSPRQRREVVLVTDFQRAGWQGDPEARLPAGARLLPVDVGGAPVPNVAVTGVELKRDTARDREQVAPLARLAATGGGAPRDVAVTLEINGRAVETRHATMPASGASTIGFRPVALPDGWSRGTVRVAPDALPIDDALHFAASRAQVVRVLVVEGSAARASGALYLRRAFGVGERPPFRVDVRRASELTAADLAGRDVVVLQDAPPPPRAARALADWVRAGGGLVVALGDAASAAAWPAEALALLPATPGSVVDRGDAGGARLATIDRAHPVFDAFAAPRSGDLSAARVLRYRAFEPNGATVLARYDDGAPALLEHAVGGGRVLVWTSTLDGYWNDLPLQPVFVPLAHRLATHAARWSGAQPWRTVGETLDAARAAGRSAGAAAERVVVRTPAGRDVRLRPSAGQRAIALSAPGFYEVTRPDAPAERPTVIAVNVDRAESEAARIEPTELVRAAQSDPRAGAVAATSAAQATAEDRERQQSAWWYLLAAALALMGIETILANRRPRVARA